MEAITTMNSGDTFKREGRTYKFTIERDDCADTPWDAVDCLGEVSKWTSRDKAPGERVLLTDRHSRRYYDFAGAVAKARKDGCTGPKAEECATSEFEWLRRWCNDEWWYVGVVVTLLDEDGDETDTRESLWGIESDADEYHVEVAHELAGQIAHTLERERMEVEYWARQEIVTGVQCNKCVIA